MLGALVPIGSPLASASDLPLQLEPEPVVTLRGQFAAGAIAAPATAARRAFEIADAMLAERERRND